MAVEVRPSGKQGRPWYLVLALLMCSGLGACGATHGWGTIEVYRGAQIELTRDLTQDGTREEDRKLAQGAIDRMLAAMDAERSRLFPLAVAELVLGVAMFVFAAAAMMGRAGARRAAVQIAIAQAGLIVLAFVLAPKYRWTDPDLALVSAHANLARTTSPEELERTLPAIRVMYRGLYVALLVLREAMAALIVVALTRQRALAFYDAQSETPTEG